MIAVLRATLALLFLASAAKAMASDVSRMEAAYALRWTDPPAFIAAVRALETEAPHDDTHERESLRMLSATSLTLQGRFDEALALAAPIAENGTTAALRSRAAALIVYISATTRDFVTGQHRLQSLLAEADAADDVALRRRAHLTAAHFYNQRAQQEPAQRYAETVLASGPDPTERCGATLQVLEARLLHPSPRLSEARFEDAIALCDGAGAALLRGFVDVAHAAWRVREGRAAEAGAALGGRLAIISATGYPQLQARAHAQLAEALQLAGDLDGAEREADAALALSAALPIAPPRLLAQRTRYAVALDRGDQAEALRRLQAVVTAERAYAAEIQRLQTAYQSGRSESIEREHSIDVLGEQNAELRLAAERASRSATMVQMALIPLGVALLALGAWAWRTKKQKRQLRQRMQVDALTGLATRAHFSRQASAALDAAERTAKPMALTLIDLDRFSSINTRFGHLSGDRLLEAIGRTLRGLEPASASFARLGGEEFAILLPNAGLDEGLAFAERCREAILATTAPARPAVERRPCAVSREERRSQPGLGRRRRSCHQ